jgi:hypothetical protein
MLQLRTDPQTRLDILGYTLALASIHLSGNLTHPGKWAVGRTAIGLDTIDCFAQYKSQGAKNDGIQSNFSRPFVLRDFCCD